MAKTSVEHKVNAPIEKVWAVLVDLQKWGEWNTMLTKWKSEPPVPLEVGNQAVAVMTIMGMANTITLTVDELEPLKTVKLSGTGMAGAKVSLNLVATADGSDTDVSAAADFESKTMVGAIGAAIERSAKKELEASLKNFEALVK